MSYLVLSWESLGAIEVSVLMAALFGAALGDYARRRFAAWASARRTGAPRKLYVESYLERIDRRERPKIAADSRYKRLLTDGAVVESLAEECHDEWVRWSRALAARHPWRLKAQAKRWRTFWVPYGELPEVWRETDRVVARGYLAAFDGAFRRFLAERRTATETAPPAPPPPPSAPRPGDVPVGPGACPTCGRDDGFHDAWPHKEAGVPPPEPPTADAVSTAGRRRSRGG